MEFLEADEPALLHTILINHTLIASEESRPHLLINCGLEALRYTMWSIEKSPTVFVNELCARLSLPHVTAKPSGQPGLIALLNYLGNPPYDVDLSTIEKDFFERIKRKCQQWFESQNSKRHPATQLLDQERQRQIQQSSEPAQAPVKIDRGEIIVSYDLNPFMSAFVDRVNYGKASAFAIGGDFNILRDYIIERMCQELKRKVPGIQKMFDVSINRDDEVEGESIIEKKLMGRYKCDKLIDLFKNYPKDHSKVNIVIVVWNYACPPEKMRRAAIHFWKVVEESISPFLREQGRCLVFILANVDPKGRTYQIDKFTVLRTPYVFETTDLLPWVKGRLENLEIDQNDVEHCLERLGDQRGDFIRTYREMEYIVNYLQGKYNMQERANIK